jgi:NAD-dependent DNA ligase
MPLLPVKEYLAPTFDNNIAVAEPANERSNNKEFEWTLTNHKEIKKERDNTFEINSKKYYPKFLCLQHHKDQPIEPSRYVLALSIKAIGNKQIKSVFNSFQVLLDVLCAMKYIYHNIYLGPTEQEATAAIIHYLADIPTESGNIKQCLETSISN